jgi:small conductance mechanosensitive channel
MSMAELLDRFEVFAREHLLPFGLRFATALAIFYIGRLVARAFVTGLDRVMDRAKLDVSLRKFLHDLAYTAMLIAIAIAALDALGVKTTALVAVLGAAGLAIGLALQGSLSNFAAGVMLIILRPYRIGDLVTVGKYTGRIDAIRIFHTLLVTADNRAITIPNGQIITNPIENLTALGRRRIDLIVSVADGELMRAKQLLEEALRADARVETAAIEVSEIGETAVKLAVRPWTETASYGAVAAALLERIRERAAATGLKLTVAPVP